MGQQNSYQTVIVMHSTMHFMRHNYCLITYIPYIHVCILCDVRQMWMANSRSPDDNVGSYMESFHTKLQHYTLAPHSHLLYLLVVLIHSCMYMYVCTRFIMYLQYMYGIHSAVLHVDAGTCTYVCVSM